jgi:hypothetical protein
MSRALVPAAPQPASGAAAPLAPAPHPQQLADEMWLYNAPAFHNAIAWSDDNVLAVAAGPAVAILSAADLGGARHYAPLPVQEPPRAGAAAAAKDKDAPRPPTLLRCRPRAAASSASLPLVLLADGDAAATARAVAWSPAGCAPGGAGCLLAVLSSDRRVRVFGLGPTPAHSRWEERQDLTAALVDHFDGARGWADVDPPPGGLLGNGSSADDVLRLRGGGSGRKPKTPAKTAGGGRAAAVAARSGRRAEEESDEDGMSEGEEDEEDAAAAGKGGKGPAGSKKRPHEPPAAAEADGGGAKKKRASKAAAQPAAAAAEAAATPVKRGRGRPPKNAAPAAAAAAAAAGGVDNERAAAVFPIGAAVEVTNDEDGLRGCWFSGRWVARALGRSLHKHTQTLPSNQPVTHTLNTSTRSVQQRAGNFALVQYNELFASEDGTTKLREWFPLPAPLQSGSVIGPRPADLPGGHAVHESTANCLRPRAPPEVRFARLGCFHGLVCMAEATRHHLITHHANHTRSS